MQSELVTSKIAEPGSTPDRKPRSPNELSRNEHSPSKETREAIRGAPDGEGKTTLRLREVNEVEALRAIEPAWQALCDEATEPNPFYEPWSLLPALENLAPSGLVTVLLIDRQHPTGKKGERELCGVLPIEHRRPLGKRGPVVLRMYQHPYAYLGTPLVRAGTEAEVFKAFFGWLTEGGIKRCLFRLDALPADGVFRQRLTDFLYERSAVPQLITTYTRAFFRKAESADGYLERAVGGKRRKEHRRLLARLAELGRLDVEELGPEGDFRKWATEFAELEQQGWKGRESVAVESQAAHARFFHELVRHAHLRGRLLGTSLRLDGRPLAMKLNLLSRGGSVALKITYDEAFAKYSPGVLLELDNIHRLHGRGDVPWMDSCAAPNRFMINQLWSERREVQSVLLSSGHPVGDLAQAAFPLARTCRRLAGEAIKGLQAFRARRVETNAQ